jgi:hypothetical protein
MPSKLKYFKGPNKGNNLFDLPVRAILSPELDGFFTSPHDVPAKWLLVLYAYLGESVQEQTEEWMSMGGFVGTSEQWSLAASLWPSAIAPRKNLHMKSQAGIGAADAVAGWRGAG